MSLYVLALASTQDMPKICNCVSGVLTKGPKAAYLVVYHESDNVLNIVESEYLAVWRLPQALPVGIAGLYSRSDLIDEFGIGDSDFQERILGVVLEAKNAFPHHHLH